MFCVFWVPPKADNDAVTVAQTQGALQAILGTGVTVSHPDGVFSVTGDLGGTGQATVHDAVAYLNTNKVNKNLSNLDSDGEAKVVGLAQNAITTALSPISNSIDALNAANVNWTKLSGSNTDPYTAVDTQAQKAIQAQARSAISLTSNDTDPISVTQNSGQWLIDLTMATAISNGDSGLVTGSQMHSELRPTNGTYVAISSDNTTAQNLVALDSKIAANNENLTQNKANIKLDNIDNDGMTVVRNLAKESVKVIAGTNTSVTTGTQDNATTYAVNVLAEGKLENDNLGLLTGDVVYDEVRPMGTGYHYIANQKTSANLEALDIALFNALNGATGVNKSAWWGALGGSISSDSADAYANNGDGFVTGKAVASYVNGVQSSLQNSLNGLNQTVQGHTNTLSSYGDRLDTNANNIAQNAQVIATKLDQSEFNTYKGETNSRFDSVESLAEQNQQNIAQNAQDIATKLDKSEFNTYKGETNSRFDSVESLAEQNQQDIAQNTAAIATKLDKSEFNTYKNETNGRLDSVESLAEQNQQNIAQNTAAIATKLDKSEFNTFKDETNGRLDSVESLAEQNQQDIAQNTAAIATKLDKSEFNTYKDETNGRLDSVEGFADDIAENAANIATNSNDIAQNRVAIATNTQKLQQVEALAGKHTTFYTNDTNLTVENMAADGEAKNYLVTLNKKLELDSIKFGTTATVNADGLNVGTTSVKDGAIITEQVSANQVTVGSGDKQIVMNGNDGTLKVAGVISGVENGDVSATSQDAVNGSQLFETREMISQNASNIQTLNQQINKTYDKVQRVGAGAAALAALRPQDFSADHPVSGAVGLGHYDGKQAIAVGMFYRPTENLTVGFGASAAGNDDYMMNAGISYRFGGGGSYNVISQSDINRKVVDLTDQNRALVAQIESSNIREEASAKRLNRVQKELKAAQKKAELSDQKLDMVMKELAALREEIQKMKQK